MTNDEKPTWTKIGFQQTVQNLVAYGPTVGIGIAEHGAEIRKYNVSAQIDTGAAGTGISPNLAERLGLQPIDSGVIHEAGREPISANIVRVRLFIDRMDIDLDVVALPSLAAPHEVLIGRDILERFRLLVDFTNGITQLHFKNPA